VPCGFLLVVFAVGVGYREFDYCHAAVAVAEFEVVTDVAVDGDVVHWVSPSFFNGLVLFAALWQTWVGGSDGVT
jgi:hypothetical protein